MHSDNGLQHWGEIFLWSSPEREQKSIFHFAPCGKKRNGRFELSGGPAIPMGHPWMTSTCQPCSLRGFLANKLLRCNYSSHRSSTINPHLIERSYDIYERKKSTNQRGLGLVGTHFYTPSPIKSSTSPQPKLPKNPSIFRPKHHYYYWCYSSSICHP